VSADRDVTSIVRSWLQEGVTALPDRVLDVVLDQLPATPQRRAWWPAGRFNDMNTFAKLAVVAAAVVAVAIVGIAVMPRPGGVAAPSPSATAIPSPTPSPLALPSAGALDAGAYYIAAGPITPARLTFTVPAGWATREAFVFKGPAATNTPTTDFGNVELIVWTVTHVYNDICKNRTLVSAGTTAAQLVSALRAQKGRVVSAPTSITLGGFPATRMDMTVPAGLDVSKCDSGIIRFWPDPGPDESGGLCCSTPGSTDVVYVVDVAGDPFAVAARHQANSTSADIAELDNIVASIRLEPSTPSPAPSASQ
jgi:hypothetical protein